MRGIARDIGDSVLDNGLDGYIKFAFEAVFRRPDIFFNVMETIDGKQRRLATLRSCIGQYGFGLMNERNELYH